MWQERRERLRKGYLNVIESNIKRTWKFEPYGSCGTGGTEKDRYLLNIRFNTKLSLRQKNSNMLGSQLKSTRTIGVQY